MKRRLIPVTALGAVTMIAFVAAAPLDLGNETINYTYDARERLTNVTHSGSVNNNVMANYTYDKADNRVTVNVTGAP